MPTHAYTHVDGSRPWSEHRIAYFNSSCSEKWLASTKWPLTFNLHTLYSRRLWWRFFFPLCLATGSQPSLWVTWYHRSVNVLMTFHLWDMALSDAGFSVQAIPAGQTMYSVQWYGNLWLLGSLFAVSGQMNMLGSTLTLLWVLRLTIASLVKETCTALTSKCIFSNLSLNAVILKTTSHSNFLTQPKLTYLTPFLLR